MEPLNPQQTANILAGTTSQRTEEPTPAAQEDAPTSVQAPEAVPAPAPKPTDILRAKPGDPHQFTMPNGKACIIQKPATPTSFKVARFMGNNASFVLETYYTAMLWIKQIGSLPIPEPKSVQQLEQMLELIGDEGLMVLVTEVNKLDVEVPPLDRRELGNS